MAEPRNPLLRELSRVLAVGSVVVGLVMVGWSQVRVQYLVDQLDQEADLRVASACEASWERIGQIRDGIETGYRRNANTLLGLASTPSTPEQQQRLDAYREQVEKDVVEIRTSISNPDCDLEEARRELGR